MAGHLDDGDSKDGLEEPGTLLAQPGEGRRPIRTAQLVGRRQTDRSRHVLGSGPTVALLRPALLLGEDVRAVSDVEGADARRALELVGAEGHQVSAQRFDIELDIRRRLDGVDMEHDTLPCPDSRRDLGYRLGWARPV